MSNNHITPEQLPQVKVRNLARDMVIIDPEGNPARVIRVRWIDHQRAKLETDIGAAVVGLDDKFPVIAGADPS